MKVIDLINKIAKGEETPKFYIDDDRYTFYFDKGFLRRIKFDIKETDQEVEWNIYPEWLNREVTIIEEEKEIEKLNDYFRGEEWFNEIGQQRIDDNFDTFARKINELIDVINEMRDKEC